MQGELEGDIEIIGVNQHGLEAGNADMCAGRTLAWLQEGEADDVWGAWSVAYRDVIVLDRENHPVAVYNLTVHDLADPANYDALKTVLEDAAAD